MTGIISYGVYIPRNRLKLSDIASVWGKDAKTIESSLGVKEKCVAGIDEDAVTLAIEASREALVRGTISPVLIQSILVGSESHPYAVNPTSTIVGEFLGVPHTYLGADLQFACKAATTGLILTSALVSEKKITYGLVVGSDAAQAKPHDVLEYTAGAGAVAFVVGEGSDVAVELIDYASYSSDTPDFWRRDGISYPTHSGRFTGEPSYFTHVLSAGGELLKRINKKPSDFDYCVFHAPNGKFPIDVAKRFGFTYKQLEASLVVEDIGNPYSASALCGLVAVLEQAKPNQTIFMVSYGSGAGADAFILKTTKKIERLTKNGQTIREKIKNKEYISYIQYLKMRGVI